MTTADLRMEILEQLRLRVEAGEGLATIEAISTAAMLGLAMPTWLSRPVMHAIANYQNYENKTLDEAFCLKREKGKRQDAEQSERANALNVITEVLRLHSQRQPMDSQIFEAAGETCNVKKTTAEKWFYKHKNARTSLYLVAEQIAGMTKK